MKDGMQLSRTVRINEEIKQVVRISAGINLMAINAMLVAKRSGARSAGYGVVSGELRSFSGRLESIMLETSGLISRMIGDVASLLNQKRSMARIGRASGMSEITAGLLEEAMESKHLALSGMQNRIRELGDRLGLHSETALRHCQSGVALARSAKIESVYGGEMAGVLEQVSVEVEGRMLALFERLKSLSADVRAWQA